jgi:hypothetical protein
VGAFEVNICGYRDKSILLLSDDLRGLEARPTLTLRGKYEVCVILIMNLEP